MRLVFIVHDIYHKFTWKPLVEKAESLGHEVIITEDINTEGDIGFYCLDRGKPGKQKLRVVTINGLDQDHVVRPDYAPFFLVENWKDYDVGFLPGNRWMSGYVAASKRVNCSPKFGVYELGWPKSDNLFLHSDPTSDRVLGKHKRRVLYAPQKENDGKQKQVIDALEPLDVELYIKHWGTAQDIKEYAWLFTAGYMNNLKKELDYAATKKWVTVLDVYSNFMNALENADILITDQSSVMYESVLCGIPTITVRGWTHCCSPCGPLQPSPDICLAVEGRMLTDAVDQMFNDYQYWVSKALEIRDDNFVNLGDSSRKVLETVFNIYNSNCK